LNSSPFVFFESNKGKVHVVVDGDPITFASGAFISFNLNISKIDLVDFIVDERGEKVIVVMKKK
jgi:hypothetical protein